jgi:hypothetical protein
MKEERVLELWRTAVAKDTAGPFSVVVVRFAELVAAETREECAKICDDLAAESEYAAVLIRRMS